MDNGNTRNNTKYWIYNDNPKLPTIVMIHGFRGTHHGLNLIAEKLDGYRVIVPDLPGFGETRPLRGNHSLENYVKWLHDFINDLKLSEPPILLGHSFGSIVTSRYTSKFPETIKKLIIVNPIGAPALSGPKAIMSQMSVLYYWLGRKLPEKLATKWLSSKSVIMIMSITMAKTRDKKTRKFIHSQHLTHFNSFTNRRSVTEAFHTSIHHNVRESAPDVKVSALIIAGDHDDITPLHKQHELAKLFPDAKIDVIKNVGHLTHYEKPNEVADAIKKFTC